MSGVENVQLEFAEELAANDHASRAAVDPRDIPTRYSLLKQLDKSPAHYLEACQQPQDDTLAARLGAFASDRKEAFRIGGAIHAKLSGAKVLVYTGGRRDPRVKAWQDYQKQAAAEGVAEIIIPSEASLVDGVVNAIRARDDAMSLLFDGTLVEKRIDWTWMGKSIRSTPDARRPGKYVVDLKSCRSSEPNEFKRSVRWFHYHAQAELYGRAMDVIGEGRPPAAFVIAVEKTKPYPVTIFRFSDEMLDIGAKLNRLWIEKLLQCERANEWPAYTQAGAVVDIDVDDSPEGLVWE